MISLSHDFDLCQFVSLSFTHCAVHTGVCACLAHGDSLRRIYFEVQETLVLNHTYAVIVWYSTLVTSKRHYLSLRPPYWVKNARTALWEIPVPRGILPPAALNSFSSLVFNHESSWRGKDLFEILRLLK